MFFYKYYASLAVTSLAAKNSLCVQLQQAIQENHDWERKKRRGHATSLLKKAEEEKETMAELAVEAAATAAMRRENIVEVSWERDMNKLKLVLDWSAGNKEANGSWRKC